MKKIMKISPRVLYPMTTIESINPKILEDTIQKVKNNEKLPAIKVVVLNGYYIITEGNYEMLASSISGKAQVDVELFSWEQRGDWLTEETLKEQLSAIGMNAVYDFEALGGFKYSEYPAFYKK